MNKVILVNNLLFKYRLCYYIIMGLKKCISFCLWGDKEMYLHGAIENVKLAKKIYPDWKCRFYIPKGESIIRNRNLDSTIERRAEIPKKNLDELKSLGAEIIYEDDNSWNLMFSRFFAIEDYDIIIIRDTDSRLSYREKNAVESWVKSDYKIHAMRDNPWHTTEILGGMWGFKKGCLDNIRLLVDLYKSKNKNDYWQTDQSFLKKYIYKKFKNKIMVHAEFVRYDDNDLSFPTKRYKNQYVGQPYDENNRSLISIAAKHTKSNDDEFYEIDRD